MFGLFRARKPAPVPCAPEGTRIYAIGDIHGRLDLLSALHDMIRQDIDAAPACRVVVVYLGDYVDRGFDSRQVVDLLLAEPLPAADTVHLKGNHEALMLDFLDDGKLAQVWLANGGDTTLFSYGITANFAAYDETAMLQARISVRETLPASHLAFLRGLAITHAEGNYLFVHAGIRPGIAIEEQREEEVLWIRDPFLTSNADHGYVVVHGHSITDEPEFHDNRISIDTGAYASGRLTCLVLENADRRILST